MPFYSVMPLPVSALSGLRKNNSEKNMASWLEKLLNQQIDDLDAEEGDEEAIQSGIDLSRNVRVILAIIVTIISAFITWWIMS